MDTAKPRTPATRARLLKTSAALTTGIALAAVTGTVAGTVAIANHAPSSSDGDNEDQDGPGIPSFGIPGLGTSESQQNDGGSNGS